MSDLVQVPHTTDMTDLDAHALLTANDDSSDWAEVYIQLNFSQHPRVIHIRPKYHLVIMLHACQQSH